MSTYEKECSALSGAIASVESECHAEISRLENLLGAARDRLIREPEELRTSFAALMLARAEELNRKFITTLLPIVRRIRAAGEASTADTTALIAAFRSLEDERFDLTGRRSDEWRLPMVWASELTDSYPQTLEFFARPEAFSHAAGNRFGAAAVELHKALSAGADRVVVRAAIEKLDLAMARACAPGAWSPNSAGMSDAQQRFDVIRFAANREAAAARLRELDAAVEQARTAQWEQDRQRTIRIRAGNETPEDLEFLNRNPGFLEGLKGLTERLFGPWLRDVGKARKVSDTEGRIGG